MKKLFFFLLIISAVNLNAQVLPEPTHENVFYITPLWEKSGSSTDSVIKIETDKLITQFGKGNIYYQLGFSGITVGSVSMYTICKEKKLRIGEIISSCMTHHLNTSIKNYSSSDLRAVQWRLDGITWKGGVTGSDKARDLMQASASRYNPQIRNLTYTGINTKINTIKTRMKSTNYPYQLAFINAIVEEELAQGGDLNNNYLGDYSPFAITEFRDWLRHTGMYDGDTGKYAGQGAPANIVGTYLNINNKLRSPFYDDPSPADANGTGVTFNSKFGQTFSKWTLKYWDLTAFPNPITDTLFDPTPSSGQAGFTSGGFDAPRTVDATNTYWNAWSWDVSDHGGAYPIGNPSTPAFGFRQQMVKNWVKDIFSYLISKGLPSEIMYSHQIPAEDVSTTRLRSSASPLWTGILDVNGHGGFTRFGTMNIPHVIQYTKKWGIFEWHPLPNSTPSNQALYNNSLTDLRNYKINGGHVLCPGWWQANGIVDPTFPMNDSKFAEAIKTFLSEQTERPYWETTINATDYTPPAVTGLKLDTSTHSVHTINFSNLIWNNHDFVWTDWSQFSKFNLQESTDSLIWSSSKSTTNYSFSFSNRDSTKNYYYRVCAVSKKPKSGDWIYISKKSASEITKLNDLTNSYKVNIYPNPSDGTGFNIDFGKYNLTSNYQIEIMNLQGQILYSHQLSVNPKEFISLGNNLAKGIYLVKFSNVNRVIIKKIVIE